MEASDVRVPGLDSLFSFQSHVFVRRGERPARDESESRLGHARTVRVDEAELPDRGIHRLVIDELLDPVQGRLAALSIDLAGLLAEEPVDVGATTVDVGA